MSNRPSPVVAVDATPLLGARTGVGAFTGLLLGALAQRPDLDITAYGLTWRGRHRLASVLPAGVRMCRRPMPARPLRFAWERATLPPVEWWTGTVDVVHGTNFVAPPTRRAGTVVTVHDLTSLHFPELCDAATLAFPAMVRAAILRGARVHAVSRFVADDVVAHLGADPAKVTVVHHGVPPVPPADPAVGHRLAGSDIYVLALGTVEPRKDLPALVRAFDAVAADHPSASLVLAGPDGWGAEALDRALCGARHRNRVRRLGWVGEDERAALLRGATVLAYPSRYEGFGFPPLEAMSVGVAVVASTAGALPEVLGDAAALVPVGDVMALAETLGVLLRDPDRRAALATAGKERAARYRWDCCADGMVALYEQAAGDI